MAVDCEVCAAEPSKYRCPACGLMSCSLGCTQSHKIYCEPKPQNTIATAEAESAKAEEAAITEPSKEEKEEEEDNKKKKMMMMNELPDLESLGRSSELHELFTQYPRLRSQLYDIYKTTLEEEWVEVQPQSGRGRGGSGGRGRGRGGVRNRGQWTREKGFSRGLGKVRKSRERCEAGLDTGKDAEGFMRFVALVNPEEES